MEIIATVAVLGTFALFFLAGNVAASGTETVFTAYFRGCPPDPWPHGVQEEYIERPWGRDAPVDSPLAAGVDRKDCDPEAGRPEIVDFFPAAAGQTQHAGAAAAPGAAAASAGAAPDSAGAHGALLVQRVRGPHLRARL